MAHGVYQTVAAAARRSRHDESVCSSAAATCSRYCMSI
jgi:hypothetical protein